MAGSEGFAYLLALVLKWTLMEAFVVPTGAMAPTIYGAHSDVACQNCGMKYAVSMSSWAQNRFGRTRVLGACPNCSEPSEIGPREPILQGDRILVEKISQPRRWDLMVFRYPEDRRTNYIMRVVGMPGETVEIADGDVFVNGHRLRKEPNEAKDMWLLVHDSQQMAKRIVSGSPRWDPGGPSSGWRLSGGQWTLSETDATPDALVFAGRLTDEIAYNEKYPRLQIGEQSAPLVGDIKLMCKLAQFSGEGSLEFRWKYRGQKVVAMISGDRQVALTASEIARAGEIARSQEHVGRGRLQRPLSEPQELTFVVRDGQAYLADAGGVVASVLVGPQDLVRFKKQKDTTEPCRLEILGRRCSATLSRIVLWKDVYYRNLSQIPGVGIEPGWGGSGNAVRLGLGEYYVLGENSCRSKDSRFWGVVPPDAVVGVARWIYWPLGRCHRFQ